MSHTIAAGMAAALLALLHWAARYLTGMHRIPRSAWLSAASGVSVAYVFVHLLPEIAHVQDALAEGSSDVLASVERQAWLLALAGLVVFYGLERWAQGHGGRRPDDTTPDLVGWVHIASYATYNGLIGALLIERAEQAGANLWAYTAAMAAHFVVNDHGLRESHGRLYHDVGRYVLAVAVVGGWALSTAVRLSETAVGLPLAFLGGSIVLNVLKEELPEERESRLAPFVAGTVAYAAALLVI